MLKNLWLGASGMRAQTNKMDNIANNIANINTTGYKKSRAAFQDLLYQEKNKVNMPVNYAQLAPGYGAGVKVSSLTKVFLQGTLYKTGGQFDMAIDGKGFFAVKLPDGERAYTRDGSFNVDGEGKLVNKSGLYLDGDIEIPDDAAEVRVTAQGRVIAIDAKGAEDEIGEIELYQVQNLAGLKAIGSNLYQTTTASGDAENTIPGRDGVGQVRQGFLEGSNVDLAEEMTNMISAQRAYQISSRVIKTADQMWDTANNIKR